MIIDLREKEDYDLYHIKEAVSFPGPNITRDKFTYDMIKLVYFINREK
jgi:centrosomal protein CEP41